MLSVSRVALFSLIIAVGIAGCAVPSGGRVIGGQPVQISELPTLPGSVELANGASHIIDPEFHAAQQETPPFIGLGIEVDKAQRTFSVPPDTTFATVKSFYADKLQSGGWREDGGMRVFTDAANRGDQNLQGAIWVRIDQTLMIVLATDPASGNKELSLSLATH